MSRGRCPQFRDKTNKIRAFKARRVTESSELSGSPRDARLHKTDWEGSPEENRSAIWNFGVPKARGSPVYLLEVISADGHFLSVS